MEHSEEHWKNHVEKLKVIQKCPRCGELGLKYAQGRIRCGKCDFEQNVGEI